MVEIEEINDNDGTEKDKVKPEIIEKDGKTYRKQTPKKDLPSVAHLLAHGSPESQGRPKTFCDIFGFPIFVAICFGISLLIFHYAPHDKSVNNRRKFTLPKRQPEQEYKPIVPEPLVDAQVPQPPKLEKVEESTREQTAEEPRDTTTANTGSEEL